MAPRCGKKRFRVRNPVPVWLPLPRPCLRSLNMPDPQCYVPISPEMFLSPWALPPCFTKPMCHCANENFCTTSNCQNSTECLKMRPVFCPYGTSDLQENIIQENENNEDHETSSNSDMNICSACGAPPSKPKMLDKKSNISQDNQLREPNHTSQVIQSQDSSCNLCKSNQGINIDLERNLHSRETATTRELERNSPENIQTKIGSKCCGNSSCQTADSNSRTRANKRLSAENRCSFNSPRADKRFSDSTTNYAGDSNTSSDKYSTINKVGCSSCAEQKETFTNVSEKRISKSRSNIMRKELGTTKKSTTDIIHVDQLPDNLSNARKKQASKYSGCCFAGSDKSCKIDNEIDRTSKPEVKIPYNDINKSRKKTECECYSTKKPVKVSTKSHKLSDCLCSSAKLRKNMKRDLSPNKVPQKHQSRTRKPSECECSSTKITKKTKLRKVSESSSPSSDNSHKTSSKSRKGSETGIPSTEGVIAKNSSSKSKADISNKSCKDICLSESNVAQSNCQCKFPPAFENLSCTGNLSNNCCCTNNH